MSRHLSRHKALSAGRCDGLEAARAEGERAARHKALSAGRCDGLGALAGHFRIVWRVTKPCQRAGVMDALIADYLDLMYHVTKPCQRAGVMDFQGQDQFLDAPESQSPVSGQV